VGGGTEFNPSAFSKISGFCGDIGWGACFACSELHCCLPLKVGVLAWDGLNYNKGERGGVLSVIKQRENGKALSKEWLFSC
jgi:hypothetical protein